MAILKGRFLRGIVGPVVFKKAGDKQQVTAKAGARKQTPATKAAANIFGLSGSLSQLIRTAFKHESEVALDGSVHARLSAAINSALNYSHDSSGIGFHFREDSFQALEGFDFNDKLRLCEKLPASVIVGMEPDELSVDFPKTDRPLMLRFPKKTDSCELTFNAAFFRLQEGLMSSTTDRYVMEITNPSADLNGLHVSFPIPKGSLCLLTLSIEYFKRRRPLADAKPNAGGILLARITPGDYEESGKFRWMEHGLCF
ncbi:hypothetical protein ACSBL2_04145 [Pedobacter sp. AW31-3R]|uniref:hypothetical protein n=1 Tax=Pedobacter sp. AW31-3R TaxID=3445781 RepID=UPI003FA0B8A8